MQGKSCGQGKSLPDLDAPITLPENSLPNYQLFFNSPCQKTAGRPM
jgi:hypothetical protein